MGQTQKEGDPSSMNGLERGSDCWAELPTIETQKTNGYVNPTPLQLKPSISVLERERESERERERERDVWEASISEEDQGSEWDDIQSQENDAVVYGFPRAAHRIRRFPSGNQMLQIFAQGSVSSFFTYSYFFSTCLENYSLSELFNVVELQILVNLEFNGCGNEFVISISLEGE